MKEICRSKIFKCCQQLKTFNGDLGKTDMTAFLFDDVPIRTTVQVRAIYNFTEYEDK